MGAGLSPASAETGRLRANGAQRRRGRQQRGAQQQRAGGSARRSRDQRQQERHVASLSTEVRVCRCLPQPPLALAAELSSRPQLYTVQLPLAGTRRCLSVWMLRASFGRHWAATQHGCRKCHSSSPACAGYPHACFQQPGLDLPFHAGRQQRGRGAGCGWQRRAGRLKRRARAGAPADVGLGAPGARRHLRRRFRCVHALAVWQGALLASRRAGRSCIRMRSSSAMLDRERRCRGVHPDEALVFGCMHGNRAHTSLGRVLGCTSLQRFLVPLRSGLSVLANLLAAPHEQTRIRRKRAPPSGRRSMLRSGLV